MGQWVINYAPTGLIVTQREQLDCNANSRHSIHKLIKNDLVIKKPLMFQFFTN